jgi:hypothetical protein
VLQTPVAKDFLVNGHELPVQADSIRVISAFDDFRHERLSIRFIFGTTTSGGFEPAARDDGLVVCGASYTSLKATSVDVSDEASILQLCAQLCAWDGAMHTYGATPSPTP